MVVAGFVADGHFVGSTPSTLSYFPYTVHGKGGMQAHEIEPSVIPDQPWFLGLYSQG